MDLKQDIIYRLFTLNDGDLTDNILAGPGLGAGIVGCAVDSVTFSDVDVVQFMEKRSQQDGMDAGTPFLGVRRIRMAGTLYNVTRALLYDDLARLRAALSPVLSAREEPLDYGYRPLFFSWPTNRNDDYPSGAIELQVKAMPRAFDAMFTRDASGGSDGDPLAIPWQATFICKDPGIFGATPQDIDLTTGSPVAGTLTNRGNYLASVNALIVVGSAAGTIAATIGDSNFTITVPASTGDRTIRFKGGDKVLTVEEDSVEVPRMDLITFNNDTTWPLIDPGDSSYSWTFTTVVPDTGSHAWFYEQYA